MYTADTTWIAIAAAILMSLSGVCLFIFAVKRDYFRDFEDAKYQVFWNDIAELIDEEHKGNNDATPQTR